MGKDKKLEEVPEHLDDPISESEGIATAPSAVATGAVTPGQGSVERLSMLHQLASRIS